MKLLVTGGAGFIGSAFVRLMLSGPATRIVNLDKLTYAGNLENLESIAAHPGYRFVQGDICDAPLVDSLLAEESPDALVHFAAESHVDRSIFAPSPAFETRRMERAEPTAQHHPITGLDAPQREQLAARVEGPNDSRRQS